VTRYRWVTARKAEGFPITMACAVADVSRQAFHDWRARTAAGPTAGELAEAELVAVMREIHAESDATYGEPRMTVELANRGRVVNHKRVRRLMRYHGIVGVHKPAKVRTTIPAEEHPPLPDLVGRRFAPAAPDVVWCGDITYVATGEGWLYVASVLDLGSRRLLGYSMAEHMRTRLVTDALEMAAAARGGETAGVIFHGDTGGCTRASATCHPSRGNSCTVNPKPTWPRNQRDRSTGGTSVWPAPGG
jgi:putative transposase